MMSVGLHMRLTGHPGRAKALIRFIEHILAHSHVWVCRREDIARHWIARFPAGQLKAGTAPSQNRNTGSANIRIRFCTQGKFVR